MRRNALVALVTLIMVGCGGGAMDDSDVWLSSDALSNVQVQKDQSEVWEDTVNPCTGDLGTLRFYDATTMWNLSAYTDDGWIGQVAENGNVEFIPDDPSAPSFTGRYAYTDGAKNFSETSSFMVQMNGSDGSHVVFHETDNFKVDDEGNLKVFFVKPTCAG